MIRDNSLSFCTDMAHNGTPAVVDLKDTYNAGGAVNPLEGFVVCSAADAVGMTALVLKTGTTSSPSTTIATIPLTHTQVNAGICRFAVPRKDLKRYMTISFTGISAGTRINAGLVMDVQDA
jgi:hypothetical protein